MEFGAESSDRKSDSVSEGRPRSIRAGSENAKWPMESPPTTSYQRNIPPFRLVLVAMNTIASWFGILFFCTILANADAFQDESSSEAEIPLQQKLAPGVDTPPANTQNMEAYPFKVVSRKSWRARPFDENHPLAHCTHYDRFATELGLNGLTRSQKLAKIYQGGRIIVHHSEGNGGSASMQNWHLDGNGWEDLGYHFVIELDGTIRQGRDLMDMGRHAGQPPNHKKACEEKTQFWLNEDYDYKSIGIVLVGSYSNPPGPSNERKFKLQMESLKTLVGYLSSQYNIKRLEGHSHYRFGGTSCPGKFFGTQIRTEFKDLLEPASTQVGKNGPFNRIEPRLLCRVPDGCEKLK